MKNILFAIMQLYILIFNVEYSYMNIFGDPWSFSIIHNLSTYLMLFIKRCQDYYYPISYLISMAIYNAKRSILALFINWATFRLLQNREWC
jgi:hypothetical protein